MFNGSLGEVLWQLMFHFLHWVTQQLDKCRQTSEGFQDCLASGSLILWTYAVEDRRFLSFFSSRYQVIGGHLSAVESRNTVDGCTYILGCGNHGSAYCLDISMLHCLVVRCSHGSDMMVRYSPHAYVLRIHTAFSCLLIAKSIFKTPIRS